MRLAASLLFTIFVLAACAGGGGEGGDERATQKARDVIISESHMGQGNWLLTAREADFQQDGAAFVFMHGPHLIFKVKGREDSSIKSHEGRFDFDANLITMSGRVAGASKTQGVFFETERVFYDANTKLIWADTPVQLTRGGVKVNGRGMRATADLAEIEIFKQKTQLPPNIEELKAKGEVKL